MTSGGSARWAFIVEGHGEVQAVPSLVRTWFPSITIAPPVRVSRDSILRRDDELQRYVALARGRADVVVVLLDADDDDPMALVTELTGRVVAICPDRVVRVCVAVREFEAWFLAAASAIGLGEDEPAAEAIRDAKGAVRTKDPAYRPITHQARYAVRLARAYATLTESQRAPSLRTFHDALAALLVSETPTS